MDADIQSICDQVVDSWKKTLNPPRLQDYLENTLEAYIDAVVAEHAKVAISNAIEAAMIVKGDRIQKLAEAALDEWIAQAAEFDYPPAKVSKAIIKELSKPGKVTDRVQEQLIAVKQMHDRGSSTQEIAETQGITQVAAEALLDRANQQIRELKDKLAAYGALAI